MPNYINKIWYDAIKTLLGNGFSAMAVSEMTGISRTTVNEYRKILRQEYQLNNKHKEHTIVKRIRP